MKSTYIKKAELVGDMLTSSENQKRFREMTGEEAYFEFLTMVNSVPAADIDEQPTVDAVEVVRCAQCIYSRKLNRRNPKEKEYTAKCIWCSYYGMGKLPNDYCSDGERRCE